MKNFKDLGVSAEQKGFVGEKISSKKILNRQIEVHDFMIKPSKHYAGSPCIWLQIKYNNELRVVFLEGKKLQEVLEKVSKDDFPFETTIVQENDWYDFT